MYCFSFFSPRKYNDVAHDCEPSPLSRVNKLGRFFFSFCISYRYAHKSKNSPNLGLSIYITHSDDYTSQTRRWNSRPRDAYYGNNNNNNVRSNPLPVGWNIICIVNSALVQPRLVDLILLTG